MFDKLLYILLIGKKQQNGTFKITYTSTSRKNRFS